MVKNTHTTAVFSASQRRKQLRHKRQQIDLGTPEIQAKRTTLSLEDLNHNSTIAGNLMKGGKITLEEIEIFQKIFLLRKRYLSLQRMGDTAQSHLRTLLLPRTGSPFFKHVDENESLEEQWRTLVHFLHSHDKNILRCIIKLFDVHSFESLATHYTLFRKEFNEDKLKDFAYFGWSAWKFLKSKKAQAHQVPQAQHGSSMMHTKLVA